MPCSRRIFLISPPKLWTAEGKAGARGSGAATTLTSLIQEDSRTCSAMTGRPAIRNTGSPAAGMATMVSAMRSRLDQSEM